MRLGGLFVSKTDSHCQTCGLTDREYSHTAGICSNPWHGDAHGRRTPHHRTGRNEMPTPEERISTLLSNLEAAIKTADPNAPHYLLLLQVKELAEIVKLHGSTDSNDTHGHQ
jgi:hypothetical protein